MSASVSVCVSVPVAVSVATAEQPFDLACFRKLGHLDHIPFDSLTHLFFSSCNSSIEVASEPQTMALSQDGTTLLLGGFNATIETVAINTKVSEPVSVSVSVSVYVYVCVCACVCGSVCICVCFRAFPFSSSSLHALITTIAARAPRASRRALLLRWRLWARTQVWSSPARL